MHAGLGQVIGMDHARYSANGMKLIAEVIYGLLGAVIEVRCLLGTGLAHRVAVAS